ncbi:hypothetical protein [Sedimenticola selenatireducens]|nr:hypothetical protein [Sedimenticola selenatireducens]
MRFMIIVKATNDSEAGVMPAFGLVADRFGVPWMIYVESPENRR